MRTKAEGSILEWTSKLSTSRLAICLVLYQPKADEKSSPTNYQHLSLAYVSELGFGEIIMINENLRQKLLANPRNVSACGGSQESKFRRSHHGCLFEPSFL
ncbi:MAG: hypothetical protein R2852_04280 [Bacteroidia bacterium]